MKNKFLVGTVFLLMLIGIMPFAIACSCIALTETSDRFENAGVVFSGIAENVEKIENYEEDILILGNALTLQKTTFQVDKYWKLGNLSGEKSLIIESYENTGANCGFNFEEDKNYIVYAYVDEVGKLTTNSCMETMEFNDEEAEDLNELAVSMKPLNEEIEEDRNLFLKFVNWFKKLFS